MQKPANVYNGFMIAVKEELIMLLIPNTVFTRYIAHLTKRGIPSAHYKELPYFQQVINNSLPFKGRVGEGMG
jgi:hypothetical protein